MITIVKNENLKKGMEIGSQDPTKPIVFEKNTKAGQGYIVKVFYNTKYDTWYTSNHLKTGFIVFIKKIPQLHQKLKIKVVSATCAAAELI